jgi:transcriptional regulator with XRE-family HTH domain
MVVRLNPDGCTVNNILDDSAVYAGIRVAKPFVIVTNSRMSFANKVRDLLAQRGIRQEDMADAIGVRQQTVSRWLGGPNPPKARSLLKIARFLKVPCDYLVDNAQQDLPQSSKLHPDDEAVLDFFHALGLSKAEALRRLAGPKAAEEHDPSIVAGPRKKGPAEKKAGDPPIVAGPRKPTPAEKKASDPPIVAGPRKKGPAEKKAGGAGGNRQGAG